MLTGFRKAADNIFVRILLGLIAFSFVVAGASSFLSGNNGGNVISFSKTESIPVEQFLALKAKEIEAIQNQNNINLTEEQIAGLNIDKGILQRLINDAMINYLAKIYDFDLSEEEVIRFVKKMPYFKDQNGNFDFKLFKDSFRNSKRMEDEYLVNMKSDLIKTVVLDVFMESFKPSRLMVDNIVNYMAMTRNFDTISIDLTQKQSGFKPDTIDDKTIEEYYKNNENDFILPELRSFSYFIIDKEFFGSRLKLDESEIKNYYEENKNDFDDRPYSQVKDQVGKLLSSNKLEELTKEIVKQIEDDIAGGLNLLDISKKYNLKIVSVDDVSKIDLANRTTPVNFSDVADGIFEMTENETSYPLEIPEQDVVIVTELTKITVSKNQTLEEVKDKICALLQEKAVMDANIIILEEVRKDYDPKKTTSESLKAKGIKVKSNQSLARADLEEIEKNYELLKLVFKTQKGNSTDVVKDGKTASFAFIKSETTSQAKSKKIIDTSSEQINKAIKQSVMQELIGYLTEQNDMKVNM